jgi:hypothetical protein
MRRSSCVLQLRSFLMKEWPVFIRPSYYFLPTR